jgi:hypothetical protein
MSLRELGQDKNDPGPYVCGSIGRKRVPLERKVALRESKWVKPG